MADCESESEDTNDRKCTKRTIAAAYLVQTGEKLKLPTVKPTEAKCPS